MTEKKTWHRPELVVLTRSRPQETVLESCKHASMGVIASGNDKCKMNGVVCERFAKT